MPYMDLMGTNKIYHKNRQYVVKGCHSFMDPMGIGLNRPSTNIRMKNEDLTIKNQLVD